MYATISRVLHCSSLLYLCLLLARKVLDGHVLLLWAFLSRAMVVQCNFVLISWNNIIVNNNLLKRVILNRLSNLAVTFSLHSRLQKLTTHCGESRKLRYTYCAYIVFTDSRLWKF